MAGHRAGVLEIHLPEVEVPGCDEPFGGSQLRENRRDVHASVRGHVAPEPARCLRELALRSRPVAAAGVVPGDGHVDEALEEVALLGRRLAPLLL